MFVSGLLQYPGVVEYAFVRSNWLKETPYFGGPIELGTDGVKQYLPLPTLTIKETFLLDTSKANLKVAIRLGEVENCLKLFINSSLFAKLELNNFSIGF